MATGRMYLVSHDPEYASAEYFPDNEYCTGITLRNPTRDAINNLRIIMPPSATITTDENTIILQFCPNTKTDYFAAPFTAFKKHVANMSLKNFTDNTFMSQLMCIADNVCGDMIAVVNSDIQCLTLDSFMREYGDNTMPWYVCPETMLIE